MNFKRSIFLTLTFLVGVNSLVNAQKDPEAEELLKAAASKALAYKTIHTKFNFKVENAQEETEDTYIGELWIKGDNFKMNIDKTLTFSDGKNRWVYLPDVNEATVTLIEKDDDLDPEERFLVEPLSLFTLYQKGFKYRKAGSQLIDNKNYEVIDLSPEDITKPYYKIKCWIAENKDYYAVKYFQKDGTRIWLQFDVFSANEKIKDAEFQFKASQYPGVEIIDLRE